MKQRIILLVVCCFAIAACRKETSSFVGPSIDEIYSDFTIITSFDANRDSVDFFNGQTVVFSAAFNKIVNWQIAITGQTSKAVKIITGTSKTIDATNGTWDGSTTVFPMFKDENCIAQLTIKDVADTFTVSEKIILPKKNEGLLIADFEMGLNPAWPKFIQSGANMDFKVHADSLSPQAKRYLNMAGTVDWDYLIGLIDFPATAYGTAPTFALPSNPNDVYFNCLIYGVPNTNPSIVLFQFKEDENSDGTFNANNEDQYDYQVNVDWAGWKLITVRYSDLVSLSNGLPVTPKGNGVQNPNKLGKISLLDLADPNGGFASTAVDYIIFTTGKPLNP